MAITERTVQNKRNSVGELAGKPGIVYDVNIKHKVNGQQKTHSKKGFATKKEALQYEAAMKNKLSNPSYVAPTAAQRKMTVEEYLEDGSSGTEMLISVPVQRPATGLISVIT